MLTKEISDVEKELELEFESKYPLDSLDYIKRKDKLIHLRAKLSTLKSAQAKFDKFKEDIKKETREWLSIEEFDSWCRKIDELSSKQEGKE